MTITTNETKKKNNLERKKKDGIALIFDPEYLFATFVIDYILFKIIFLMTLICLVQEKKIFQARKLNIFSHFSNLQCFTYYALYDSNKFIF